MTQLKVRWLFVVLLVAMPLAGQDLDSLSNFHMTHDGSEILFSSDNVPKVVKDILTQRVGIVLLVKPANCNKGVAPPCFRVTYTATAFVVGDHVLVTNFHLFEGFKKGVFVLTAAQYASSRPMVRSRSVLVKVIFGGKMYDARRINSTRYENHDLALLQVDDPNKTFTSAPVSFTREPLVPGLTKLYTLGFYSGCDGNEDYQPDCQAPGFMTFRIFKNYSKEVEMGDEVGILIGNIPPGFSGSPVLNDEGICVGINAFYFPEHLRAYFIPSSEVLDFLDAMGKIHNLTANTRAR